jgi:hypothetical protein
MNILSQELRDRAQSIVSRIEEESRIAQEARKQKREELRLLAIDKFREKFTAQVSEEVIKSLGIEIKDKFNPGAGLYVGENLHKRSETDVYARINLVDGCYAEIYPYNDYCSQHWKVRRSTLDNQLKKWRSPESYGFVDLGSTPLEEAILKMVLEFEQEAQEYEQVKEKEQQRRIAEEAERGRRRLEDAAFVAKVKATDAEIRQLIEKAIAPYRPQWKEGFVLKVYKWRYCTGAADGDFDYQEVFSLSPYMHPDEETGKLFVVTVEGDRIALESEIHKPVIYEVVCDSIESARDKLGRNGFYLRYYGLPSFTLTGVNKGEFLKNLQYGYDSKSYWIWEEGSTYHYDLPFQMQPWLRKVLGLLEVPSEIHIKP